MLRHLLALLALGLVLASAAPASARPHQDRRGWGAAAPSDLSGARRHRHHSRRHAKRHRKAHRARHARHGHQKRQKAVRQSRAVPGPLYALVSAAAQVAGVPLAIAHAVVRTESRYNPRARGSAGEIGLTQLKMGTARGMGYRGTAAELYDPATNLKWGFRYLAAAYQRSGGNWAVAASLYNRGIYSRRVITDYGRRVMRAAR